jgi:hypothetical protein
MNASERTVGAALRGRPFAEIVFAKSEVVAFVNPLSSAMGAATEGRPTVR